MAGLNDAIRAAREAQILPTVSAREMFAAQPRMSADEATLLDASNSPTLVRGLRMGLRGMASGITGYGAGMLEAAGSPAADEWYAAANEQARQAALQGPSVQRWADVTDPTSFGEYALGQMGAAAPMLAPAVGLGAAANVLRLSPAATVAAGAAPMHPVLAGGAMLRMKDDPVSAQADPTSRAVAANVEGGLSAALLGAVPGYMTARALGRPGAAAAPTANPLRTAGGIATDTALSAGAQGAAGVGAGEIGRAVQSSFNPDYVPEEGARMEEFASNALGALPMVAPLAVSGRVLGAHVEPGKNIAGVALRKGADLAKEGAAKLAPGAKAAKTAFDDAMEAARMGRDWAETRAIFEGSDATEARIVGAGAGAEAFAEKAAEPMGRWARKLTQRLTDTKDNFTAKVMEKFNAEKRKPTQEEFDAEVAREQGETLAMLNTFAKQSGVPREGLDALMQKYEKNGRLDPADAQALSVAGEAMQRIANSRTVGDLMKDAPAEPAATGEASRSRDVFSGKVRELLTAAEFDDSFVKALTNRLSAADIRRAGVTRAVREAVDSLGLKDPEAVRVLNNELAAPLRELKAQHMPDVHELGTEFTVAQFGKEVAPVMEDLFAKRGLSLTDRERSNAVKAVTDFFTKAANGEKDFRRNAPRFMAREFGRFGDEGAAALAKLRESAKAILGEGSAQYRNLTRSLDDVDTATSEVAQLRSLVPSAVKEGSSVMPLAEQLREDMDYVLNRSKALFDRKAQAKALMDAYEARAREQRTEQAEANAVEARKFYAQAEKDAQGADVRAQLKREWAGLVPEKNFEAVFALMEKYRKSDLVTKPDAVRVNDTAASRAAPTDDVDPQAAAVRAYERGVEDSFIDPETGARRELTDEEQYAVDKIEASRGTQGEASTEFIGQRSISGSAHDDMVPLDTEPSADYAKGMASHVYDSGHYGHRLADLRSLNVQEWAEQRSLATGEKMHDILNRSLKELLRADEARRVKLGARAGEKGVKATLERIAERRERAAQLMRTSPDRAGYNFFNDPRSQNLRFLAVEQSDAANLKLTVKDLERVSLKDGVRPAGYAAVEARKNPAFPASVYEQSLMPVKLADGTTLTVDIAKLVQQELRRHQSGDIVGVGDKKAVGPAEDQRVNPTRQFTPQEIHTALMNVLATIATAKGVAADAFGVRLGEGRINTATDAADRLVQYLDRGLVVLRDQDNNRAWTVGQLEGRGEINPATGLPMREPRVFSADDMRAIVKVTGSTTAKSLNPVVPGNRTSAAARNLAKDPKLVDFVVAAERGVQHQRLEKDGKLYDLNTKELLRSMAERYDIDYGEMMRDSDTPTALLAELFAEGMAELDSRGFKPVDNAMLDKEAWSRAVVGRKEFEDRSVNVTMKDLQFQLDRTPGEIVPRTMPRSLDAAKIAYKKKQVERIERVLREWDKRRKEGSLTLDMDKREAAAEESLEQALRSLDFLTGYFDPMDGKPQGNKYRAAEIDNSRVAQILYDLGGREAPSFDRATQQLFFDAANEIGGRSWAAHQRRLSESVPLKSEGEGPSTKRGEFVPEGKSAEGVVLEAKTRRTTREPTALDRAARSIKLPEGEAPRAAPAAKPDTTTPGAGIERMFPVPEKGTPERAALDTATAERSEASTLMAESVKELLSSKEPPSVGQAAPIIRELDAAALRDVALSLPPKKQQTLAQQQFANVLSKMFETKLSAAKLEQAADGSFIDKRDVPFSMARSGEMPKDPEAIAKAINDDVRSMLGDLVGVEVVRGKIDTAEGEAVGLYDAGKVVVSLLAENQRGVASHESWHAVRDLLKAQGDAGKQVLDTIERAVDTPMMRAWLERQFDGDEGALKQIRESSREREAYAFQAFRDGQPMPLAPEARSIWRRLADFLNGLLKKVGLDFTSDSERANNFFKYVSDGGFLRDHENPAAFVSALGRTRADNYRATAKEFLSTVAKSVDEVAGSMGERIEAMGNEHYSNVRRMFEGERGKGGYTLWKRMAVTRFANAFNDAFAGAKTAKERSAMQNTPAVKRVLRELEDYAAQRVGMDPEHARKIMDSVYAVDQDAVAARMPEFMKDLIDHGGVPKRFLEKNDGHLRDIAARLADEGFIDGLDLFRNAPEIREKWMTPDPQDLLARKVETLVNRVERERAFGKDDKNLIDALNKGDELATSDQKELMDKAVKAYEHRLGHDKMSPATKKLMNAVVVANNVRLLPFGLFSQMLDPMKVAFRKNDMNAVLGSLASGIAQLPRSFKKIDDSWTPSMWEKLGKEIGTVAPIASMLSDMQTGFHISGKAGKLNDLFFRYTGQEAWNRAMTIEATKHAVEFLRQHSGQSKDFPVTKHSERFMKELGLKPEDVKFNDDGLPVRNEKVDQAIMQFVHEAMAYPDPGSNTMWMNDARFSLISQMKRFLWAHNRYILERGEREWGLGNKWVALPYLSAVPLMLVADQLRDVANFMSDEAYKKNWTFTDHLSHAYERTGAMGRAQVLQDAVDNVKRGGSGMEALFGPTAELFSDLIGKRGNWQDVSMFVEAAPEAAGAGAAIRRARMK